MSKPSVMNHSSYRNLRHSNNAAVFSVLVALTVGLVAMSYPAGAARSTTGNQHQSTSGLSRKSSTALNALPKPPAVQPFQTSPVGGEGQWRAVGRHVDGTTAIYTTVVRLPDDPTVLAGIAWLDTKILRARLYSGSLSPGGFNWKLTAPISNAASRTLVAAFNGGYQLKDSRGGYLSEGRLAAPLRVGAASLVIYKSGFATVGLWGRDVRMTSEVVAVRQNLNLLVENGHPVPGLSPRDISAWGVALHQVANTWRSGLGVTANGALVYVAGPMTIVDLANLLVRAGAVRAMVLDMNPEWPVFATYSPARLNAPASASNGTDLLSSMTQTPARFFQNSYARDFITMSVP